MVAARCGGGMGELTSDGKRTWLHPFPTPVIWPEDRKGAGRRVAGAGADAAPTKGERAAGEPALRVPYTSTTVAGHLRRGRAGDEKDGRN